MKLKTLLIDDEPLALDKLAGYAARVPYLEVCARCSSAFEALEYLANHEIDLIFTDINMPDMNGVDFVQSLAQSRMVVFTTAYSEYAIDSYRLGGVDYLLKPYTYVDFQRAANRAFKAKSLTVALKEEKQSQQDTIFVKVESRHVRVDTSDIRYIKGYGEYLRLYLASKKQPLMTISSFASILTSLPSDFLQVHRSYIVNMNHVQHVERNRIVMDADTYIPVSDGFKDDFQQWLERHTVKKSVK